MDRMAIKLNPIGGVLFPPISQMTQQKFDDLAANFATRPGDVIIVSYPKSGSTWARQIVKLIQGDGIETGHVWETVSWLELKGINFCMVIINKLIYLNKLFACLF
jgi:hypothetical protein